MKLNRRYTFIHNHPIRNSIGLLLLVAISLAHERVVAYLVGMGRIDDGDNEVVRSRPESKINLTVCFY